MSYTYGHRKDTKIAGGAVYAKVKRLVYRFRQTHLCDAMLLQAAGRANALRGPLKAEAERSPDFLRLANALSALYPKGCEEKRLLDAMLLAVPR